MKAAIAMYGQPRFIDTGIHFFKKNLFDINPGIQFDTFIHSWINPELDNKWFDAAPWLDGGRAGHQYDNVDKKYLDFYKPRGWIFEPQRAFNIPRDYSAFHTKTPYQHLFSYYYSIQAAVKLALLEDQYDWIFIARPDWLLLTPLDLTNLDPGNFYYPDDVKGNPENKEAINANFLFSSAENMEYYSKLFEWLDIYWCTDAVRMGGECMSGWHIHTKNRKPLPIKYRYVRAYGSGEHGNEIDYAHVGKLL